MSAEVSMSTPKVALVLGYGLALADVRRFFITSMLQLIINEYYNLGFCRGSIAVWIRRCHRSSKC